MAIPSPSCPILVVQEDGAFRKSLIAALDQAHFAVTMANEESRALDYLGQRSFPIVIFDLDLPYEANEGIVSRLREKKNETKVIALASGMPELRSNKDLLSSFEEVLWKPVDVAHVVKRARRYCE